MSEKELNDLIKWEEAKKLNPNNYNKDFGREDIIAYNIALEENIEHYKKLIKEL